MSLKYELEAFFFLKKMSDPFALKQPFQSNFIRCLISLC